MADPAPSFHSPEQNFFTSERRKKLIDEQVAFLNEALTRLELIVGPIGSGRRDIFEKSQGVLTQVEADDLFVTVLRDKGRAGYDDLKRDLLAMEDIPGLEGFLQHGRDTARALRDKLRYFPYPGGQPA